MFFWSPLQIGYRNLSSASDSISNVKTLQRHGHIAEAVEQNAYTHDIIVSKLLAFPRRVVSKLQFVPQEQPPLNPEP